MQNRNKPKKKRVLLSLTILTSLFAQLTAPVVALAAEEVGDSEPAEEIPSAAPEDEITVEDSGEVTGVTEEAVNPEAPVEEGNTEDSDAEDSTEEVSDDEIPAEASDLEGENIANDPVEEDEGEAEATDEAGETNLGEDAEGEAEAATFAAEEAQTFQVAQETFELAIAHMNDTHGRVNHFPYMITAINEFRAANENNLLLHAGDVFSGTLYFNEFLGLADLDLLNLMDIDAMVFGNHEFDLGVAGEGHEALGEFVANAEFPFVGTNIDFSADPYLASYETNESLAESPQDGAIYDSIVFDIDGEQVGLFGLTTEDTANIASPIDVVFSDYIVTAQEAVDELEAAGIDKIIALTHIGFNSAPSVGNDLVLADNVEGIDIIVGGHSHTALEEPAVANEESGAPTVIVQAGENAEHLGTLNVEFNEVGEIINHAGELLVVDPEETSYAADPTAANVLAPYQEAVDAVNNEEIGAVAQKDLENPRHGEGDEISVRANETPLGNLVTDAMLYKAREKFPEIDFSVQNGGGIRAPIDAGPITTGEVIQVLPFGNNPVIAELTGQEIRELFEISVQNAPEENGGFLHVSGLELYFDSRREPGDRVQGLYIVRDDGELEEVEMDETYLVTTNGFTGTGGDGLTPFAVANAEGRVRDIGEIDWQQLRDYMVEEQYLNGVVDPVVEGRINNLAEGAELPGSENGALAELLDRVAALEAELQRLAAQNRAQADEIAALREQVAALTERLADAEADIAALEAEITQLEARIAELDADTPAEETPGEEEPDTEEPVDDSDEVEEDDSEDKEDKPVKKDKSKKEKEKVLPQTGASAMSVVLPLVTGATLVISGLGVETYRKKNNQK